MADSRPTNEGSLQARLRALRVTLKSGDYNGADIMAAWCAMTQAAAALDQMHEALVGALQEQQALLARLSPSTKERTDLREWAHAQRFAAIQRMEEGMRPSHVFSPGGIMHDIRAEAVERWTQILDMLDKQPDEPEAHYDYIGGVPVHPTNGPLWANVVTDDNQDRPRHYPLMPIYCRRWTQGEIDAAKVRADEMMAFFRRSETKDGTP